MSMKLSSVFATGFAAAVFAFAPMGASAEYTDYYLIKNETAMANYSSLDGTGSDNTGFSGWAYVQGGTTKVQYGSSYGAVDPNGIYHMDGKIIRAKPTETTSGYTFAGYQLVFDGELPAINDKLTKNNVNKVLKIDNLLVASGSFGELRQGDDGTKYLAGANWVISAGGILALNRSEAQNTRNWSCSATITGAGELRSANGIYDPDRGVSATAAPGAGTITYTGDLTGFLGRFNAGDFGQTHRTADAQATLNSRITTIIAASTAFPTNTPDGEIMDGAVVVTNGASLSFQCDVTSPVIRGWDFGSGAVPTVNVDSGYTVYVHGPVAGTVGLKKTGSGTLVFNVGGDNFFDVITLTGVTNLTAEALSAYAANCDMWKKSPMVGASSLASSSETAATFSVAIGGRLDNVDSGMANVSALVLQAAATDPWDDASATTYALGTISDSSPQPPTR